MNDSGRTGALDRLRRWAGYPVIYMFTVTFLFTAVLIGIANATRGRVEANRLFLFERAVLSAVGAGPESIASPARVHSLFNRTVLPPSPSSGGAYRHMDGERLVAYALPIEGQGFWDVIRGVVGIAPGGRALTGIAFYQQKETPGLGAEISKPRFRGQFEGAGLSDGPVPLALYPSSSAKSEHHLDAVTGATETCTRLERIINTALVEWRGRVTRSTK